MTALEFAAVAEGVVLTGILLFFGLRMALAKPLDTPPAPPPTHTEVEAAIAAARDERARITALVLKAAQQHWLHEVDHQATHKVSFDPRQRHAATTQRAVRLLHEAKGVVPADLRELVKDALELTKGVPHA